MDNDLHYTINSLNQYKKYKKLDDCIKNYTYKEQSIIIAKDFIGNCKEYFIIPKNIINNLKEDLHLYEYINNDGLIKIYFDIDININDNEMNIDIDIDIVINDLQTFMNDKYNVSNIDIIILESHSSKKKSYHIIFKNILIDSKSKILQMIEVYNSEYDNVFDTSVYNNNQLFRSVYQSKLEDKYKDNDIDRILTFYNNDNRKISDTYINYIDGNNNINISDRIVDNNNNNQIISLLSNKIISNDKKHYTPKNDNESIIYKCYLCFNKNTLNDYIVWRNFTWVIQQKLNDDGRELWDYISKQFDNYDFNNNNKQWDTLKKNKKGGHKYGFTYIKDLAKKCNQDKFNQYFNTNNITDNKIFDNKIFDIADFSYNLNHWVNQYKNISIFDSYDEYLKYIKNFSLIVCLFSDYSCKILICKDDNQKWKIKTIGNGDNSINEFLLTKKIKYYNDDTQKVTIKKYKYDEMISDNLKYFKMYKSFDIYPNGYNSFGEKLPNNIFNVWNNFQGFINNNVDNFDDIYIKDILHHIKTCICDDNEIHYQYIINWLAYIIQFSWKKTKVFIVLFSIDQQIGKGIFTNFLYNFVFGKDNAFNCNLDALLYRFNDQLIGKNVCFIDEVSELEKKSVFNKFKSIITEPTMLYEKKSGFCLTLCQYLNIMLCTNNLHSIYLEQSDARCFPLKVSNRYKCNTEYFNNLIQNTKQINAQHFIIYLKNINLSNFNPTNIPLSDIKTDMIELSLPSPQVWLNHIKYQINNQQMTYDDLIIDENKNKTNQKPEAIRNTDLYVHYENYCIETKEHVFTFKSFGKYLKQRINNKKTNIGLVFDIKSFVESKEN